MADYQVAWPSKQTASMDAAEFQDKTNAVIVITHWIQLQEHQARIGYKMCKWN